MRAELQDSTEIEIINVFSVTCVVVGVWFRRRLQERVDARLPGVRTAKNQVIGSNCLIGRLLELHGLCFAVSLGLKKGLPGQKKEGSLKDNRAVVFVRGANN